MWLIVFLSQAIYANLREWHLKIKKTDMIYHNILGRVKRFSIVL